MRSYEGLAIILRLCADAILKHFHAKAVGVILFYILAHIIYPYLFIIAVVYFKWMMWNNFCSVGNNECLTKPI